MPTRLISLFISLIIVQLILISPVNATLGKSEVELEVANERIRVLRDELNRLNNEIQTNRNNDNFSNQQRFSRYDDYLVGGAFGVLGFIVFNFIFVTGQAKKQVSELVDNFFTNNPIDRLANKVIDEKVDNKLKEIMKSNFLIAQGLSCFNNGDFASAYEAFKSLHQNFNEIDSTFITAHYAYLATKNNDFGNAKRLYKEILSDKSNCNDDYYIKSAINYSDFHYTRDKRKSLQILEEASLNCKAAEGIADIYVNLASYFLLEKDFEKAQQYLNRLQNIKNLSTRPKVLLEYLFYKFSYNLVMLDESLHDIKTEILNLIENGCKSEYWNETQHLKNLRTIFNNSERYSEIEQLAKSIKSGIRL